ncbi:poly(A)-specific ribonuclease PARN-like domain-containing protein 1 isoform X3 [Turdus rufiventris]|nr:poly(A)-specific ribonuclease PARN-like domain-containing protein 1 isoform X3 [Turdus rufiventris]
MALSSRLLLAAGGLRAAGLRFASTTASLKTETEVDTSENEVVAPNFTNRNPRNLELMALARKERGWKTTWPKREFWHSLFDSPAERYVKARQSVQRFTLLQLGLAIFSKENSNKYVVHSYNFFLFPSTLGIRDVEFTISASSIQFLSHYGFDFNKFLKNGIPYMNEVQEKILRQHLLAGTWKVCSCADRDVLKKAIDEVTSWIAAAKEEDTMILQDLNAYHMLDVQLVLRQALENVWTEPLGDKKVMVKKVSPEHRQLLENSSYDRCQKKLILLSARGFTNLFQILVKAKKFKSPSKKVEQILAFQARCAFQHVTDQFIGPCGPLVRLCGNSYILYAAYQMNFNFRGLWPLVGHNMLIDLMHLHDKFYRPLPESYEEFKKNIHNLFPVIIDTKTVTKSVQKNFSGEDAPCHHPPALVVHVRGWPGLTERQIYQEFKACRFDVRRLSKNQFILLSNKYKQAVTTHPQERWWRVTHMSVCQCCVTKAVPEQQLGEAGPVPPETGGAHGKEDGQGLLWSTDWKENVCGQKPRKDFLPEAPEEL